MFTLEDVKGAVRWAVETAGPEYVYPPSAEDDTCLYLDDTPMGGCIAGAALRHLDPEAEFVEFSAIDAKGYDGNEEYGQPWVRENVEEGGIAFLRVAQARQDDGRSWGEAVDAAEEVLTID